MSRPKKPKIAPEGQSWIRRKGMWVLCDNQVLRWRKENKKRAYKNSVDALYCGRELDLTAPPEEEDDIFKVFG
jgi:hypothetical protein